MKDKSRKLYSIHKEIKFYQLVLIKLQDFGMLKPESPYKFCKDIKIKSFLVCLTTKETQSLQAQKIIHARSGEIQMFTKRSDYFSVLINKLFIL